MTSTSNKARNFSLDSIPTSLIFCPPLPTTIPTWESRSTRMVAPILMRGFCFLFRFLVLLLLVLPLLLPLPSPSDPSSSSSSSKYRRDSSNVSTLTSQQYGSSFPNFVNSVSRIDSDAQNRSVRSVKKSGWYSGGPNGRISRASRLVTITGAAVAVGPNIPGTGRPSRRIEDATSTFGSFAVSIARSADTPGSFGPSAAQAGSMANASGSVARHLEMVCTAREGVLAYASLLLPLVLPLLRLRWPPSPFVVSPPPSSSSSSLAARSTLLTTTMTGRCEFRNFVMTSSPTPKYSSSPSSPSSSLPSTWTLPP
mmetsp:Transcript_180/g.347  ORF Transcript_180/g.347 Transcript_180/m.347 type:complete len:311 (+) Transcript_180:224-1156(+)